MHFLKLSTLYLNLERISHVVEQSPPEVRVPKLRVFFGVVDQSGATQKALQVVDIHQPDDMARLRRALDAVLVRLDT